jgi:hypothetical protein
MLFLTASLGGAEPTLISYQSATVRAARPFPGWTPVVSLVSLVARFPGNKKFCSYIESNYGTRRNICLIM